MNIKKFNVFKKKKHVPRISDTIYTRDLYRYLDENIPDSITIWNNNLIIKKVIVDFIRYKNHNELLIILEENEKNYLKFYYKLNIDNYIINKGNQYLRVFLKSGLIDFINYYDPHKYSIISHYDSDEIPGITFVRNLISKYLEHNLLFKTIERPTHDW